MVLESDFGIRQQTEQFYPLTEDDWTRINRSTIGFTVGQFHPELNPRNVVPKVTFNVPNSPNFTFDNRLVDQGEAWLTSFRTSLTSIRGSHSLKGGYYFELSQNSEGKGGVGAGPWAGQFNFSTDVNNPLDTNYSYAMLCWEHSATTPRSMRSRKWSANVSSTSSTRRTRGRRAGV
jgi:hypothetical protein